MSDPVGGGRSRLRWKTLCAMTIVLALVVAACGSSTTDSTTTSTSGGTSTTAGPGGNTTTIPTEGPRGGTLVVGLQADPTTVNPNLSTNGPVQQVGTMIYEPLVFFDNATGEPAPHLAESWDISPDGLTYTFHLVEADFSDGEPLTSTDVKYTLEEVAANYFAPFAASAAAIESIDDSDPRTVVVKLSQSFGPFLLSLTRVEILPAHVFAGTDVPTNPASLTEPVGTGPFLLDSFTPGAEWRLVRNPNYWKEGYPLLDEIVGRVMPNTQAAVLALQAGDVDYVSSQVLPPTDAPTLAEASHLKLVPDSFAPNETIVMFNTTRELTGDPAVRHALAMAIDREFIHEHVFDGFGLVSRAPFDSRLAWAVHPTIDFNEMYPYDPEAAAAALDEAGYPVGADGFRFELTVLSEAASRFLPVAEAIASMLREVGIDAKVDAPETSVSTERAFRAPGDFDLFIISYTTNGDPALGIERAYVSTSIDVNFGNASGYSNPEVDRLFQEGRFLTTYAERSVPYYAVQEILAEDIPSFPMIETKLNDVAFVGVEGLWYTANWGQWHRASVQR